MGDYYIVSDEYAAFAENTAVLTVTRLIQALRTRTLDPTEVVLTPGLGLDDAQLRDVQAALSEADASAATVRRFEPTACDLPITHKRTLEHVMIGPIRRTQAREYACQLRLNRLCDRLSDHVTGQHIAGMLLIEAARQACTAALELEYGQDPEKVWGAAWSGLRVEFSAFVFPLPAELRISCHEDTRKPSSKQVSLQVAVSVDQAGRQVSDLRFDITLFDAALLQRLEDRAAVHTLSRAATLEAPGTAALAIHHSVQAACV